MARPETEFDEIATMIEEIRDEWWHDDDRIVYIDLAMELAEDTDWTKNRIARFLGTAFGAAANEYGG